MGLTAGDPNEKWLQLLDDYERRLRALERTSPVSVTFRGPRTDAGTPGVVDGKGPRVRIGLLSDGSYGVERWTAAGVRQVPTWS